MWSSIVLLVVASLMGCQTVHIADRGEDVPVALWVGLAMRNREGHTVSPPSEQLVVDALKRAGINATLDQSGLAVAPGDEDGAREALLTDDRLIDSGLLVVVPVPAGSGRRTPEGVVFVARHPTTNPGK